MELSVVVFSKNQIFFSKNLSLDLPNDLLFVFNKLILEYPYLEETLANLDSFEVFLNKVNIKHIDDFYSVANKNDNLEIVLH
jgi:hypothetical protein